MKSFLVLLAAAAVTGCVSDADHDALAARLDAAERSNRVLKQALAALQQELDLANGPLTVQIRPGDEGYAALRIDLGTLLVNVGEVRADGAGSLVTLNFGNLTAARIQGLVATLEWGRIDDIGQPAEGASREVRFDTSLAPGTWTAAAVRLDGVPPAQVGYLRLKSVRHRAVQLQAAKAAR
jgi:hypothetical protein